VTIHRYRLPAGRRVATLVAAALLAACSAEPAARPSGSSAPGPRPPPPAAAGFVRTCESSVYGELDDGWRKQSLVVGPLAFVYLEEAAEWPPGNLRRHGNGYYGQKVLVAVDNGATVTVTVPAADRARLSLLYDPATWKDSGRYQVADGDPAVTFQSCEAAEHPYGADHTQFNGGFVVAGPGCASLEVSTPAWRTPRRVTVSFAAGRCRS
jgi:hypothetical protein